MSNLDPDMGDRRVDDETRVDVIEGYQDTLRTVKRTLIALVAGVVLLGVGTYALDRAQSNEIQDQRRDALITACEEQNARNDNTLEQLDVLIAKIPRSDPRYERAQQSRASTGLLIDALAPKRDCEARARRFVK